jgi:hypothetical protein
MTVVDRKFGQAGHVTGVSGLKPGAGAPAHAHTPCALSAKGAEKSAGRKACKVYLRAIYVRPDSKVVRPVEIDKIPPNWGPNTFIPSYLQ